MKIKSGIYKITNIVTGKFYIGSAVDLYNRRYHHLYKLKLNNHGNIKLQSSFNKYGEASFIFETVELIEDKTKLIEREQFYIDTLKPHFNIRKIADSNLGLSQSEEAKEKLSKFWTGKKKGVRSDSHRRNLGASLKGKTVGYPKSEQFLKNIGRIKSGELNISFGKPSPHRRKIIEVKTNKIYDSITQAASDKGVTTGAIICALKNKSKSVGSYWNYVEENEKRKDKNT